MSDRLIMVRCSVYHLLLKTHFHYCTGTWTKRSNAVTACKPFGQDHDLVDYEHDSEAEWEPEGEGEEIQSGDEDDEDATADVMDPDDVSISSCKVTW